MELRAQGRRGTQIAARIGISERQLRYWLSGDPVFRTIYSAVHERAEAGDQEGIKVLLKSYHPERQAVKLYKPENATSGVGA